MSVAVIEPPVGLAVSLEEATAHLRVDHGDDDALITSLIKAATQSIDGPAGWLGRSLIRQTLELRLRRFPVDPVTLPYPPFREIVAIKYDDVGGIEQTLDPGAWRISGGGNLMARLGLAYGRSWPTCRAQDDAVRIRYTAGYGATSGDVPEAIRCAIKLHVGQLYENREAASDKPQAELPLAYHSLLSTFRTWP